ncbi:hypothetical protein ASPVEDRAFT_140663 [Aspergillus versicolor CBS 583.65]|uniref:ER membrane protein complex subunit 10 n=1 Tax=Aspergillus versicolor CBS 583.65 TaxID=1036611 RepID=A0A1L9PZP0_ASPVE|nr:uncharacterized protein ASPVEDRAFT_140663 [Aspergillus versicolor CBS 583.65]OJJ06872.1 hypothetical protein ASPVEDRAFT_140663 [Aspergillus versicolor CBS 583.65]
MYSFQNSKIFIIFLSLISLSSSLSSYSPQLEILYWPISSSEPSVLAHISYDPASLKSDLINYFPPADLSNSPVRVGFYVTAPTNQKHWVGTTAAASLLGPNDAQKPRLRLHISPLNEIYHVSLSSAAASISSPDSLLLELVTDEFGPHPHLNRPIVVGPDGKKPQEEPEKTLFQKYWWVLLIVTFLAMSGGGEQQ